MDNLDKMLYCELKREEAPSEFRSIIQNSLKDNNAKKKIKQYSLVKVLTTACASLLLTTGMVYAGTTIIEKIWKQPEKIVGFYSEENTDKITEEEKASVMTEEEARKKVKEILKKFGHEGEKIKTLQLENNPSDYELIWRAEIENGGHNFNIVSFDAKGGDAFRVKFRNVLYKRIDEYRTTEKEALETAKKLCEKYGYNTEKYNKIEIKCNLEVEENSYIWYVNFYKDYDGIINQYESIEIAFIPEINDIYYFNVNNLKYENNSVEITKEQAKQVVLDAEQKIDTGYDIKNIDLNLAIGKMNGDAYKRITDYQQYYNTDYPLEKEVYYRTDGIVRKIWKVIIEYDVPRFEEKEYNSSDFFKRYYTYYVDATTGEIIGGRIYK